VDYTTLDDAALIRLLAYNRSEALDELYNRYSRLVFSVALNAIGDAATAEEITQDVFTRAWEKAKTYDVEISKVSTWLISITRNRSIDELRRGRIRPERYSVSWADVQDDPVDEGASPEERSELSWRQAAVRAAISSLPVEQQEALALAYFKGYSHSEIAKALSEPLGTVKTRIRLAMQKLREILSDQVSSG
jgi:RNA polymerase sigma-70 factor (ECF subfamily)